MKAIEVLLSHGVKEERIIFLNLVRGSCPLGTESSCPDRLSRGYQQCLPTVPKVAPCKFHSFA